MINQPLTTIEEIERVTLRFMRVSDDGKLSGVLEKILPSLLTIYCEQDLENAAADNPKLAALTKLMDHLITRVENSRGKVLVPAAKIVSILSFPEYLRPGYTLKRNLTQRITAFVQLSLEYAPEKISSLELMEDSLKGL